MPIRLLFLHLTPRLYMTRIVVLACIWLILYPTASRIPLNTEFYIFLPIVIAHHLFCLVVPLRFFYGLFDLCLLLGELLAALRLGIIVGPMMSWMPDVYIALKVFTWVTFSCLLLLVIFRLSKVVQTRGKSLIEPFTIFPRGYPEEKKPHMLKILFGRSLWSTHFVGERKTVRGLRGFLGLVFLATVVFWSFSKIIFEPMRETALGPVREFRTKQPPKDFIDSIDPPVWNILIPFQTVPNSHQAFISLPTFDQSVTVTAVWGSQDNSDDKPPCTQTETLISSNLTSYRFVCPTGKRDKIIILPDLLIRVDFSLIYEALARANTLYPQVSLPIIIGMTDSDRQSVKHVLEKTCPITLIPGVNLAAPIMTDIRQIFSHRALAAFGLLQETSVFWEARFEHIYPDSQALSTDRSQNISTLRLFNIHNWSDTRVIQDYRMNSVVAGFADVGGLWTSLSGIFTVLFGASLLHILYGTKPLSIFGIAHAFHYKHMKEETLRLYPNIVSEHKQAGNRGLMALLRDHLIDLSFLDKEFIDAPGPIGKEGDEPLPDIERPLVGNLKGSHAAELSDFDST